MNEETNDLIQSQKDAAKIIKEGEKMLSMSRQQRRQECRKAAKHKLRCFQDNNGTIHQAPRNDNGVLSRKKRRDIAKDVATKAFRIIQKETNAQTRP